MFGERAKKLMISKGITPNQMRWLIARWKEGYSARELSSIVGVCSESIRDIMREMVGELPPIESRRQEFLQLGKTEWR